MPVRAQAGALTPLLLSAHRRDYPRNSFAHPATTALLRFHAFTRPSLSRRPLATFLNRRRSPVQYSSMHVKYGHHERGCRCDRCMRQIMYRTPCDNMHLCRYHLMCPVHVISYYLVTAVVGLVCFMISSKCNHMYDMISSTFLKVSCDSSSSTPSIMNDYVQLYPS